MPKRGGVARLYDAVTGFWTKVASALTPRRSARRGEQGVARMQGPYGGAGYAGGPQLLSKAEQVLHFRSWSYRCIDYICARCSKEPPSAVVAASPREVEKHRTKTKAFLRGRGPEPEPRIFTSPFWKQKSLGPAKGDEDYEFLPDDHPLVRLLADPNDPETGVSLWYEAELFNCLTGEDFIWVVDDDAGRPSELWVIPSHWVRPVCEGEERLVDYFEVVPRGSSCPLERFEPEEIIWHKRPSPLSKIYPAAPTQAAAPLIDTYEKIEAARNFSLDNGAAVGGVIEVPPDANLTDAMIQRMESRFYAKYQGVANFNRPLILEGGGKWVPAPAENELAYMQTQDQVRKYVMAHWGTDEVVMGFAAVANRAAMVAAIANVNEATINPRKTARAAVLTEKLGKRFDPRIRLFYRDDTPVDPDARRQDFQAGGALNAVAPNDYRVHVLNLEPWPEEVYDRPLVSAGLVNPGEDGGDQWDMTGGGPGAGPEGAGGSDPFGGDPFGEGSDQADGLAGDADLSPDADFKSFKPPRKFACALVPLAGEAAEKLLDLAASVKDEDLGDDGREDDPHVTALFGLHTDDPEEVRRVVRGFGPVRMRLGGVSVFHGAESGKDYDVLKADVDSPDLVRLHDILATLPHTKTHPRYVPHATIAYVRAGLGDDYARRMGRLDLDATAERLVFSDRARNRASIDLTGTKALTSWLTTKDGGGHGPPPFPGARFDGSRHRWVKPDGGPPDPEHHAAADAATARTLAGKIKAAGEKAVAAARTLGGKAKEIAYKLANKGVAVNDILDDVYDYGKLITARNTGDWLSTHLGVGGNTAAVIASHVLAYGVTKIRQHLRARAAAKSAGEPDRATSAAEILGELLIEMGCPEGELPTADGVREWLESSGTLEGDRTKSLAVKHGPPPFPGAVFDERSHRWVKPNKPAATARPTAPERVAAEPPAPAPPKPQKPRVVEEKPATPDAAAVVKNRPKVDASVQRYAEEYNEPRMAQALGGASFPDSEACDIKIPADPADAEKWQAATLNYRAAMHAWEQGGKKGKRPVMEAIHGQPAHLVELKTMTVGEGGAIDMNAYAKVRKVLAERRSGGAVYHTIASDDRAIFNANGPGQHDESKGRVYYYRRGIAGKTRVSTMHRCETIEELKELIAMPEKDLPEGARRTDGDIRKGRWIPFKDKKGRGYRNVNTGTVVRAAK